MRIQHSIGVKIINVHIDFNHQFAFLTSCTFGLNLKIKFYLASKSSFFSTSKTTLCSFIAPSSQRISNKHSKLSRTLPFLDTQISLKTWGAQSSTLVCH